MNRARPLRSAPAAAPSAPVEDLTRRALAAYGKIEDARLSAVVRGIIKHLHACVTELRPSDEEYEHMPLEAGIPRAPKAPVPADATPDALPRG